jgi:hypothetical protein
MKLRPEGPSRRGLISGGAALAAMAALPSAAEASILLTGGGKPGGGTSEFTPISGLSNWARANMPNSLTAMAALKAGSADFYAGFMGHSVNVAYRGAGNLYQNAHSQGAASARMVSALATAGLNPLYNNLWGATGNLAGSGAQASDWDTLVYEEPALSRPNGTGFSTGTITSVGGSTLQNTSDTTTGSTIRWVVDAACDRFNFEYLDHGVVGSYAYSIDGGAFSAPVNMQIDGSEIIRRASITLPAVTGSTRTVTLRVTGGNMYIFGMWGSHSANRKLHLWNFGQSSATGVDTWSDTSQSYTVGNNYWKKGLHLLFMFDMINDMGASADPTATVANMLAIARTVRLHGTDVIWVMDNPTSDTLTVRNSYKAAVTAACAGESLPIPLLDLASTYTNQSAWSAQGYYDQGDTIHPGPTGQTYIAGRFNAPILALAA